MTGSRRPCPARVYDDRAKRWERCVHKGGRGHEGVHVTRHFIALRDGVEGAALMDAAAAGLLAACGFASGSESGEIPEIVAKALVHIHPYRGE